MARMGDSFTSIIRRTSCVFSLTNGTPKLNHLPIIDML